MQTVWILLAAIAGFVLGFWLKSTLTKAETLHLEQDNGKLTAELAESKLLLAKAIAESESRASFEALATERQGSISRLEGERNTLREELRAKADAEPALAARISQLEADLRNERQNLADQAALHESTKQALSAERTAAVGRLESERNALREELRVKSETDRDQAARISKLEADLKNERENLAEKLAILETAKQALADQFQALAGKILDEKSKTFSEGSQKELGTLLSPLKTQIEEFRKKVEEAQSDSKTGVTELKTLVGTLGNLNQALTQEAHNLATALRRDTKAQGNWGETILRNILDKSGLKEGIHYSFQQSFIEEGEDGTPLQQRQTDVVVNLPGGRHLIIDSKVSLNAYSDSVNSQDEQMRAEAVKSHLSSVRKHYRELADRNYHALLGVQSPDFVVMFVPVEPAFMLAIQEDENLWLDAYERGVLLAGPTTVLFVVRIVENLWRQEQQANSVKEVMDLGGKLYVKFAAFVNDMADLGKSLHSATQSYEGAKKKLNEGKDNLLKHAERLRDHGVKPKFGKTVRRIPSSWLVSAGVEEDGMTLAAEGDEDGDVES